MHADSRKTLLEKAGAILARRSLSRAELRDRIAAGADASLVEAVLDRLEQLRLLNDADYAYNFALHRVGRRGWGPAKVRDALLGRRVAPDVADAAIARACSETDPRRALVEYTRRHVAKSGGAPDDKSARRLLAHLRRRGFEDDAIAGALKEVLPPELWRRLETGE